MVFRRTYRRRRYAPRHHRYKKKFNTYKRKFKPNRSVNKFNRHGMDRNIFRFTVNKKVNLPVTGTTLSDNWSVNLGDIQGGGAESLFNEIQESVGKYTHYRIRNWKTIIQPVGPNPIYRTTAPMVITPGHYNNLAYTAVSNDPADTYSVGSVKGMLGYMSHKKHVIGGLSNSKKALVIKFRPSKRTDWEWISLPAMNPPPTNANWKTYANHKLFMEGLHTAPASGGSNPTPELHLVFNVTLIAWVETRNRRYQSTCLTPVGSECSSEEEY